jgi:hypothetical protein
MKKTASSIDPDSVFTDSDDDIDIDAALASCAAPEGDDLPVTVSSIERNRFTRGRNGINGFCVIPLWVVRELAQVRAYHASLLVTVLLQRMRVRGTTTESITATIWNKVGSPSKWERQTVLEHLRRVPGNLKLEERHEGYTRYQVTLGEMWDHQ